MPSIPPTSLSILASGELLSNPATEVVFTVVGVTSAAALIHYASPMHLTHALVTAMTDAEKKIFRGDRDRPALRVRRPRSGDFVRLEGIRRFFKGRTLSILRCIWEVRELGTHIEVWLTCAVDGAGDWQPAESKLN
ncbi:hypothetical protein B0H19DRAFT_1061234 [Mycena capillaripes]|nr:hypothetical protein B0H19DRAFT_1061234 [Mycena capillaripes]